MLNLLTFLLITATSFNSQADDSIKISIKDHKFNPDKIEVPAGQKVKLEVSNEDTSPEEFESKVLGKEKVIKGNSKATIVIQPLKAGEYAFVGEFHEETAKGLIIAK